MKARPLVALTAQLDGTDWYLELSQSKKTRALAKAQQPPARVDFFSSGKSLERLSWEGRLQSPFTKAGGHKLHRVEVLKELGWKPPSWKGCRTYTLNGQGRADVIDRPNRSRPSTERLKDNLVEQMTAYPSATQAVILSGHGTNRTKVSGLEMKRWSQTIGQAHQETGVPVKLFVSDACNLANLEALAQLPDCVEVAVVCQDEPVLQEQLGRKDGQVVLAQVRDALPLEDVLPQWNSTDDPSQMARQLLEAEGHNPETGLTAVNVKNLKEKLLPALAPLKGQLRRGHDLGQQLEKLNTQAAATALEALGQTVIAHKNPASQPNLSGLDV